MFCVRDLEKINKINAKKKQNKALLKRECKLRDASNALTTWSCCIKKQGTLLEQKHNTKSCIIQNYVNHIDIRFINMWMAEILEVKH